MTAIEREQEMEWQKRQHEEYISGEVATYEADLMLSFPNPFFGVGVLKFSVLSFQRNEPSF